MPIDTCLKCVYPACVPINGGYWNLSPIVSNWEIKQIKSIYTIGGNFMNNTFSPYNFLKSRRPNKFSDTILLKKARLTRDFFDFYLNSLTSRSQEKLFEGFCRRIAEIEICPNLIVQTGPTGGGDSKVDSETYPVSDDISLTWYSGIGREAASERWAFAISAKQDWKTKVKADIAKILLTDRRYKKIFFMSNQYISDKKRADTEDELSKNHAIDVRILDRNWLLDRLFQNHREHIAIEVFSLSGDFIDEQRIGQLDYGRKQELEEIEQNIKALSLERKFNLEIVDKSIRAAILSRELELPLNDTIGRFNRASILATKYGTDFQKKECFYQWAWSLYWWYEEFDDFINKYCDYEKNVVGTKSFYDIERLTNLWMNLYVINKINPQEKIFKERTEVLINEYERLIDDQNRPNTALEARANFIFVNLFLDSDINKAFKDLNQVMDDCGNNIDFSFETISAILTEMAPTMQDSAVFDELFEKVVSMAGIRNQETVSSLMLFKRGQQLIKSKPYSAIKYLGRTLLSLYKDETKNEFYLTLYMLAYAHEKAGLLWAARGFYYNAFYFVFVNYMKYGELNPVLAACSGSIRMIELAQGRAFDAIKWNDLNDISKKLLASVGYDTSKFQETGTIDLFDSILGMLFFRVPYKDLPKLIKLPDVLDNRGLHLSAMALKYALGYVDEEIRKAYDNNTNTIDDFMTKWYNQPAKEQIPDTLRLWFDDVERIDSKILGCQVIIDADNKFPCVELGESILAAIESFLATGILDGIISVTPVINLKIKYVESDVFTIYQKVEPIDDTKYYVVYCSGFNEAEFRKAQDDTKEFINQLIAELIPRIAVFRDTELLEVWAHDDCVFDRALGFNNNIFITEDLLGKDRDYNGCLLSGDEFEYVLKRKEPLIIKCDSFEDVGDTVEGSRLEDNNFNGNYDTENIGHRDIEINSIINMELWDKAMWKGMLFGFAPGSLPVIAPVYANIDSGRAIFAEWIRMVGGQDENDLIKVGLIKKIDKDNPLFYKGIFTSNLDMLPKTNKTRYFTIVSRFQRMESTDNSNLLLFEKTVRSAQHNWKFWIAPAYLNPKTGQPEMLLEYAILKNSITIKDAWEIGKNDWLSAAITVDDAPIVPPHIVKAPIMDIINGFKK